MEQDELTFFLRFSRLSFCLFLSINKGSNSIFCLFFDINTKIMTFDSFLVSFAKYRRLLFKFDLISVLFYYEYRMSLGYALHHICCQFISSCAYLANCWLLNQVNFENDNNWSESWLLKKAGLYLSLRVSLIIPLKFTHYNHSFFFC